MLVDTHCHIQFADFPLDPKQVLIDAGTTGVTKVIAVGCTLEDSRKAVEMAGQFSNVWASIGLHPHEAGRYVHDSNALEALRDLAAKPKVVAVGETGLDYFYQHSSKKHQAELLRFQLDIAREHNLPVIFHIREAFDDFWPIFEAGPPVKGVVHSFTAGLKELNQVQKHNLYIGLNGIMTFTKNTGQLAAAKAIKLQNMLLETDSPYLTPSPYRGTINEPKQVRVIAEFLANLRGESFAELAKATTANAMEVFKLS